jgi:predicted TIM-barrel fold metal-dependent hydrolase
MCAYSFLGAGKMILGSDYPHVIGDMKRAVSSIEGLSIPQEDKELIYSGNLLKLTHEDH